MIQFDFEIRHIALTMVIATLIVAAGCGSLLTDSGPPSATTERPDQRATATMTSNSGTGTATPADDTSTNMPVNGTDLRNATIPGDYSYTNTYYGEIDGDDPVINSSNRYYEPIAFTAEAGDSINITLSSIANDPELRLRGPNGTTIATDDNSGEGDSARVETLTLNQTGQYTLVATSAEPHSSFDYTLQLKRYVEPNFQGPMSSWDEQSRYLEYGEDYSLVAQELAGGPDQLYDPQTVAEIEGNLTAHNWTVDTEEDYITIRYVMDANATPIERVDIDTALMFAYHSLYETYVDSETAENASWVPDRIYHSGYDYDGDLYRTSYLDREWAVAFSEAGGLGNETAQTIYYSRYIGTFRQGPAHQNYTEGGEYVTTSSEAPVGTYENATVEPDDNTERIARP